MSHETFMASIQTWIESDATKLCFQIKPENGTRRQQLNAIIGMIDGSTDAWDIKIHVQKTRYPHTDSIMVWIEREKNPPIPTPPF